MGKTKLTAEEAEEYTHNLGQITAGDYGLIDFAINTLGVPGSLGYDDPRDWVEERLGGYVRYGVEQRREAVAQLTEEGKTQAQIATILGVAVKTVARDQDVNEARTGLESGAGADDQAEITAGTGLKSAFPETGRKVTPAQVRALIDQGKSNAEIAATLDISPVTAGRYRKEYNDEQAQAALDKARADQAAATPPESEVQRKARLAEEGEITDAVKAGITEGAGLTPLPMLREADAELQQIMDNGAQFQGFAESVNHWINLGQNLWVYGARRGLDVSRITRLLDDMQGEA